LPQNSKAGEAYSFFNVGLGLSYEPNICHVDYTPESVRDVPAHPEDGEVYEENAKPIKNKSID
jgi:hypothetical protein